MQTYKVDFPTAPAVPILLSVPHCGTAFPHEIKEDYVSELIATPDDTDWFVDRLYGFAPSVGITMVSAVLSRWVIDLNRDPESKPLYTDGRIITDLCPVTTFLGQPLYKDRRKKVEEAEVRRRTELYFNPYHQRLGELMGEMKARFGTVLLWDCHSIRQVVPTIQAERFPDLVLGSADDRAAHPLLIETALKHLGHGGYNLRHNRPFKGGYITRHYGDPAAGRHVLQLEMNKVNYMDDTEMHYDPQRAEKIGELLNNTLRKLADTLISLKD